MGPNGVQSFPMDPAMHEYNPALGYAVPLGNDPLLGSVFSKLFKKTTGMSLSSVVQMAAPLANFIPVVGPVVAPFAQALVAEKGKGGGFDVAGLLKRFFPGGVPGGINIEEMIQKVLPGSEGKAVAAQAAALVRSGYTTETVAFTQPDGRVATVYNVRPGSQEETRVRGLNAEYQTLTALAANVFAAGKAAGRAIPQELQAMRESSQGGRMPSTLVEQAEFRNARLKWRIDFVAARTPGRAAMRAGGSGGMIFVGLGLLAMLALKGKRR